MVRASIRTLKNNLGVMYLLYMAHLPNALAMNAARKKRDSDRELPIHFFTLSEICHG